ncbi:MAG: hypothetical protein LBV54_06690 [Puniceicoccales bacterium]|nr:hypothetical protein [Puniceicoccales bacterium]
MAKKLDPLLYALAIPLAAVALLVAILVLKRSGSMGMSDLKEFNSTEYLRNWKTLEGNQYLLRCQIDQQLAYDETKGRMLKVKQLDGAGQAIATVAVFVPVSLWKNFETGQRYRMRVFLRDQGKLYVENVEKF